MGRLGWRKTRSHFCALQGRGRRGAGDWPARGRFAEGLRVPAGCELSPCRRQPGLLSPRWQRALRPLRRRATRRRSVLPAGTSPAPVVAAALPVAAVPAPPAACAAPWPRIAAASPALGSTGSTAASDWRWALTASWKSRQPAHSFRCRRSGPRRSSPPRATEICSRMSWQDALRASRSAIKALRA